MTPNHTMTYVFASISLIMTIVTVLLSIDRERKNSFKNDLNMRFASIDAELKDLKNTIIELTNKMTALEIYMKFGDKQIKDLREEIHTIKDI